MTDFPIVPAAQVRSFRDLLVWQEAIQLAVDVHKITAAFRRPESFELGRELRKTAISIPSNVAEGFNRHSRNTYRFHIGVALGSDGELETQLEVGSKCEFFSSDQSKKLFGSCALTGRLLQGLWGSLR